MLVKICGRGYAIFRMENAPLLLLPANHIIAVPAPPMLLKITADSGGVTPAPLLSKQRSNTCGTPLKTGTLHLRCSRKKKKLQLQYSYEFDSCDNIKDRSSKLNRSKIAQLFMSITAPDSLFSASVFDEALK